jgi:L-threonylcarbamoyladenylate synthase
MFTVVLNARKDEDIRAAGLLLREGQLVAFPTETVYGLGARADDDVAVGAAAG